MSRLRGAAFPRGVRVIYGGDTATVSPEQNTLGSITTGPSVAAVASVAPAAAQTASVPSATVRRRSLKWAGVIGSAVGVVGLAVAGWLYFARRTHALTNKDTIVLADFENKTGDAVFDDTLRQGLAVQLEQSPFLSMISDSKVNQTLKMMGRHGGDPLTPDVTREVCQRTGSKAMLTSSIAGLGSQYVIGLKAVNCQSGDVLAETQQQATSKEGVLKALDKAAVSMRRELGESLSTVQEVPLPETDRDTAQSATLIPSFVNGISARTTSRNFRIHAQSAHVALVLLI